jgi:DNA-binding CsgD family transcriptional regulator
MNPFTESEKNVKKLYDILERFYPNDIEIDFEKYLEKVDLLRNANEQQDSIAYLVDVKKFETKYLSGDIEYYFGCTVADTIESSPHHIFNVLAEENQALPLPLATWFLNILKKTPKHIKHKQFGYCWGFLMKHKEGRKFRAYVSFTPLELDENRNPILLLILIHDVTYLLKGDGFWFRVVLGETEKTIFTYYSEENKTNRQDILTEREKEILRYIAEGNDTKNIATILNISPNTVDNHRRNMLARTGTRDTTALVQLCKMMDVL